MVLDGVAGVAFAVFAPTARRVSVVGDFNLWDGRRHAMRVRGNGFWEIFVPEARAGDKYKYEIIGPDGRMLPLKSDPLAFAAELRPRTASIVVDWDAIPRPQPAPADVNALGAPISIYEVHLGSWRRQPQEAGRWLSYRELAEQLPAYARDLGFTHVEFLPVSEHPFDGSWGYQPTGLFAPTSRFGTPRRLRRSGGCLPPRRACRHSRLGARAFPGRPARAQPVRRHSAVRARRSDAGTPSRLEHAGLQLRAHRSRQLPLANGLFWLDRYRIDGLRVDAVASMLYLDYSRPEGGWIPNKHGGRENLEAIALLRRFNSELFRRFPERDHGRRGIDRLADGVAAGRLGRARLRLQVEHGVDARHPRLHQQGSDLPQASPRPDPVRPALRLLRKFHPAALP